MFGTVQVLLAFMLGLHLGDRHVSFGLGDLRHALWESPTSFLLILLMIVSLAGMVRFAHDASGVRQLMLGMVHSEGYASLHHQDLKHFLRLHIETGGALHRPSPPKMDTAPGRTCTCALVRPTQL